MKDETTAKAGALWALGHIASTEFGLTAILHIEQNFIDWVAQNVLNYPNIALRGVFFHVLGLIGRSKKGARRLCQLQWSSTSVGSFSAVAIPHDISRFFNDESILELDSYDSKIMMSQPPECTCQLSPFLSSGQIKLETELLNLVSKVSFRVNIQSLSVLLMRV